MLTANPIALQGQPSKAGFPSHSAMMARISGKSPVEYLDSDGPEARFVLGFASGGLSASGGALRLADLFVQFSESLAYENHSR